MGSIPNAELHGAREPLNIIYGPVPSWRFGSSLGVDAICSRKKICSFDCTYCQLGKTGDLTTQRKEYVSYSKMKGALTAADKSTSDVITFSGTGEPTLNTKIGDMISFAKTFGLPVAVLTNSSLLCLDEVRNALLEADIVAAKLDAPNQEIFEKVNQPAPGVRFSQVLEGILAFRKAYSGKLALQMMFVAENKNSAPEMAKLARQINPEEVQLDTPIRPSAVPALSIREMEKIEHSFEGLPTISVYKKKSEYVSPIDEEETRLRRPE